MCTMEYYATIERNEVLIYAKHGWTFENVMLSKISHTQDDSTYMKYLE